MKKVLILSILAIAPISLQAKQINLGLKSDTGSHEHCQCTPSMCVQEDACDSGHKCQCNGCPCPGQASGAGGFRNRIKLSYSQKGGFGLGSCSHGMCPESVAISAGLKKR